MTLHNLLPLFSSWYILPIFYTVCKPLSCYNYCLRWGGRDWMIPMYLNNWHLARRTTFSRWLKEHFNIGTKANVYSTCQSREEREERLADLYSKQQVCNIFNEYPEFVCWSLFTPRICSQWLPTSDVSRAGLCGTVLAFSATFLASVIVVNCEIQFLYWICSNKARGT